MIKFKKTTQVMIVMRYHTIQKTTLWKGSSNVGAEKSKSPKDIRVTVKKLLRKYGKYLYSMFGKLLACSMF